MCKPKILRVAGQYPGLVSQEIECGAFSVVVPCLLIGRCVCLVTWIRFEGNKSIS